MTLLAQNADLSGLITDPSGLAVQAHAWLCRVPYRAQHAAFPRTSKAMYSVPALPPGSYDITVEATGFKTVHQNGVVVAVDQALDSISR